MHRLYFVKHKYPFKEAILRNFSALEKQLALKIKYASLFYKFFDYDVLLESSLLMIF